MLKSGLSRKERKDTGVLYIIMNENINLKTVDVVLAETLWSVQADYISRATRPRKSKCMVQSAMNYTRSSTLISKWSDTHDMFWFV